MPEWMLLREGKAAEACMVLVRRLRSVFVPSRADTDPVEY
jgi:hypothetical protein